MDGSQDRLKLELADLLDVELVVRGWSEQNLFELRQFTDRILSTLIHRNRSMSAPDKKKRPTPMTALRFRWIKAGVLSCLLACVGDLVVPELLARAWPGYNPLTRSESILGAAGSPVAGWFTAWSICLALLFFVFAWGLHQAFWPPEKGMRLASWLLILYGIGEGLGSGLFPFDHSGGVLTLSGWIHSVLSILGSAALFLLPLAWLWRPPAQGPRLKGLSWATIILGGLFMLLFGVAKLGWFGHGGLWQRAYIIVYYIYLLALAWAMFRSLGRKRSS